MRLVIRARSLSQAPLSRSLVGEFDERGGTIGRSDSNTLALPDPERHISRVQAEVTFLGGAFSVRNVGSSNPIVVDGRHIGRGESAELRGGTGLQIGGYDLLVSVDTAAGAVAQGADRAGVDARTVIGASAREARTKPPRQAAATARVEPVLDTLQGARPTASATVSDPFADLLGPGSVSKPAAQAQLSKEDPFADLLGTGAPVTSGPPPAIGSDDPFSDLLAPAASPTKPRESARSSLTELLGPGSASPGALDEAFGLNAASSPRGVDAVDAFLSQPPRQTSTPASDDPFAFLEEDGLTGQASADHTPALQAAYTPPPVRPTAQATAPPSPVPDPPRSPEPAPTRIAPVAAMPVAAASAPDDEAAAQLWDAFCEGAGVRLPHRQRLTPELMHLLGATLRHAVEGAVELSTVRTTAKQELHVPVTTIQARHNNPLKFAPDAAAAVAMLVQPPMRGFMAAPEAMQDVMQDLLGHSVGTMAGTRAAMQGMLHRFEPGQLERQLGRGGVLETLLPMNRRAKLWELYLQHYERISEAAREDFHELFGKAFLKAYEEQIDRLASARRPER